MILLGSIQRIELLRLIELQVGQERRLQEAAKRAQLSESPKTPRAEKKLSRFEVVPVVGSTRVSTNSLNHISSCYICMHLKLHKFDEFVFHKILIVFNLSCINSARRASLTFDHFCYVSVNFASLWVYCRVDPISCEMNKSLLLELISLFTGSQ